MTRDLDLIRSLLRETESLPPGSTLPVGRKAEPERHYNAKLLEEAGLAIVQSDSQGLNIVRMTWQGHDFLDALGDDTVWNKTKTKVNKAVGSASLEVVKAVAEGVTRAQLGLW